MMFIEKFEDSWTKITYVSNVSSNDHFKCFQTQFVTTNTMVVGFKCVDHIEHGLQIEQEICTPTDYKKILYKYFKDYKIISKQHDVRNKFKVYR